MGKRKKTGAWGDPQLSPNSDSFSGSPLEAAGHELSLLKIVCLFVWLHWVFLRPVGSSSPTRV